MTRPESLRAAPFRAAAQRRTEAGQLFCFAMQRRARLARRRKIAVQLRCGGTASPLARSSHREGCTGVEPEQGRAPIHGDRRFPAACMAPSSLKSLTLDGPCHRRPEKSEDGALDTRCKEVGQMTWKIVRVSRRHGRSCVIRFDARRHRAILARDVRTGLICCGHAVFSSPIA